MVIINSQCPFLYHLMLSNGLDTVIRMNGRGFLVNCDELFNYVKNVYGTIPEYLWMEHPTYKVLRIKDTDYWYGVIMNVPRVKLGAKGEGNVWIMNVRSDFEADFIDLIGIFPSYLMNPKEWISVLLDGTVNEIRVLDFLDRSYELTENKME